jgi:hypothetical protein
VNNQAFPIQASIVHQGLIKSGQCVQLIISILTQSKIIFRVTCPAGLDGDNPHLIQVLTYLYRATTFTQPALTFKYAYSPVTKPLKKNFVMEGEASG